MKTPYILRLFALFFPFFIFSQTTILCPGVPSEIHIEDINNIPTSVDNGDGTIELIHTEQYITDIFASYEIYDFYQTFPDSGSETFQKLYTIYSETKDLIVELQASVPSSVFQYGGVVNVFYEKTPLNSDLITFVDGKTFKLIKHCFDFSDMGIPCSENDQNVPTDFNLLVEFNYDALNDLLLAESIGLTPCGNSFSIAIAGKETTFNGNIQTWKSTPGIMSESSPDQPCYFFENKLYSFLNIACDNEYFVGLTGIIDYDSNYFILRADLATFSYEELTFEQHVMSINDNAFKTIKLIDTKESPYIHFTNIEDNEYSIEVYSVLGKSVVQKTTYQNNSISLDEFSSGLYFIKLSNADNHGKVFKYLKM